MKPVSAVAAAAATKPRRPNAFGPCGVRMASFNVIMEQMVASMTAVRANMAPELAGRWTAVDCGLDGTQLQMSFRRKGLFPEGSSLQKRKKTEVRSPKISEGHEEYPTCPDDLMGQAAQQKVNLGSVELSLNTPRPECSRAARLCWAPRPFASPRSPL